MSERLLPGGPTAFDREAEDARLPDAPDTAGQPRLRWRDLPPAEQIRRSVEDTVRYYGQRWGKLPTAERICSFKKWPATRIPEVQLALQDPVTIANLRRLGILPDDVETWDEGITRAGAQPTRLQMDALDAIFERLDPNDPRPLDVVLKAHGVDLRTWNGWLADPVFGAYVRDRAAAIFGQRAHEVDIALMRRAFAGDVQALKLILELQGRIKRQGDTVDVNMVLARVVEIIQLEVTDPVVQLRIAERLEALSQATAAGQLPAGPPVLSAEIVPGQLIEGEPA